jgi:hypothetical protein
VRAAGLAARSKGPVAVTGLVVAPADRAAVLVVEVVGRVEGAARRTGEVTAGAPRLTVGAAVGRAAPVGRDGPRRWPAAGAAR